MAVNDIVAAVEIALALKIQINRTRDILLAVKIMVQVKVVVRSLDDGIIDVEKEEYVRIRKGILVGGGILTLYITLNPFIIGNTMIGGGS